MRGCNCEKCRKLREYRKKYAERNKERLQAYQREYYRKNRERMLAKNNAWNEAHREETRAKYKARTRKAKPQKPKKADTSGHGETAPNSINDAGAIQSERPDRSAAAST